MSIFLDMLLVGSLIKQFSEFCLTSVAQLQTLELEYRRNKYESNELPLT